jgi:hypothetical protein
LLLSVSWPIKGVLPLTAAQVSTLSLVWKMGCNKI